MDTHDHAPRTPVTDADTRLQDLGYEQTLQRTMSLRDVVVYGLIYMVPLAPAAVFGAVFEFSKGQVALVYLVAAIAMFFSAVSYREMAARYPVAGSVYSYVRFGTGRLAQGRRRVVHVQQAAVRGEAGKAESEGGTGRADRAAGHVRHPSFSRWD